MEFPLRTSSASSNNWRRRSSMRLTAGCDSSSLSAVFDTPCVVNSTDSTSRALRSASRSRWMRSRAWTAVVDTELAPDGRSDMVTQGLPLAVRAGAPL
ncbi:hypothetical protein D9M68_903900 [compost metagenome]